MTDSHRARLRELIAEGLASGVADRAPEDVLDAIVAEDPELQVGSDRMIGVAPSAKAARQGGDAG